MIKSKKRWIGISIDIALGVALIVVLVLVFFKNYGRVFLHELVGFSLSDHPVQMVSVTNLETGETVDSILDDYTDPFADLFDHILLGEISQQQAQKMLEQADSSKHYQICTYDGKQPYRWGEILDTLMLVDGTYYKINRTVCEDISNYFNGMQRSNAQYTVVSEQTLLSVTPDMTYQQLLELLGPTDQSTSPQFRSVYTYRLENSVQFQVFFNNPEQACEKVGEQWLKQIKQLDVA